MNSIELQAERLKVIMLILESGTYRTATLINLVDNIAEVIRETDFIYSVPVLLDTQLDHATIYNDRGIRYKYIAKTKLEDLRRNLNARNTNVAYCNSIIRNLIETLFYTKPMVDLIGKWQVGNVRNQSVTHMDLIIN